MLKYVRGYFKKIIPMQHTLVIELNNCPHYCEECKNPSRKKEEGQPLTKEAIGQALQSFKRYIESICFVGGEYSQAELKELCKYVHSEKLDTCLMTSYLDLSVLNKNLLDELDYVIIGRCDRKGKVYKKDYCAFADVYEWLEIE